MRLYILMQLVARKNKCAREILISQNQVKAQTDFRKGIERMGHKI